VIFKSLFRSSANNTIPEERLPALHSFVDVTVMGRSARSVSVEELTPQHIAVRDGIGRAGERGTFVYQNTNGKFRFGATILEVKDGLTYFQMPTKIDAIAGAAQKRSTVRLDTLLAAQWRMAPGGKGVGEFLKGSVRDISRGGCAIIMDRQCKTGQSLEIRIPLRNDAAPLVVLGEIMRIEQVPTSGKFSHGLRFVGLTPQEDSAILDFINRRLTDLRNRGLA
jgi:c-di-GMP-binding flagellar brake protein YcgR